MPTKTWVFGSEAVESGSLELLRMETFDALSRLFEIVVELRSTHEDDVVQANLDRLLIGRSYVATSHHAEQKRWGVLRSIELLTPAGQARPIYRAVLVPTLWYATQTHRSRVFQDATAVEIAATVFNELGLRENDDYRVPPRDHAVALPRHDKRAPRHDDTSVVMKDGYPKREYVLQYEETDYAFVSRLLEDEGIAFHFEYGPEREVIVLTESNRGMRRPDPPKRVSYLEAAVVDAEAVFRITRERKFVRQGVELVDYDWRKPAVLLRTVAPPPRRDKLLGQVKRRGLYFSSAQHFRDEDYGQRLAEIRLEELRVERDVYRGRTTIDDLRAGDVFTLEVPETWGSSSETMRSLRPPRPDLDGEYLVVEVRRRLEQRFDQVGAHAEPDHGAEFVAIRADVTYRPARTTPKPRIDGVLYATIDGPDLDVPAPIDQHGRYKVVLPFDLAGLTAQAGGQASRWIRMAQPLSGAGYGVHFPLHAGAEVVLGHVQGDPDRPIIVGAVPNAQTPSPVTSANPTQSVVRTFTGIIMEFEDDA